MPKDKDAPKGILDAMDALEKERERRRKKDDKKASKKDDDGLDLDDVWPS